MSKKDNDTIELLTCPQAAKFVGCSAATLYDLSRRKLVPSIRLTPVRGLRFDKEKLRQWVLAGGVAQATNGDQAAA